MVVVVVLRCSGRVRVSFQNTRVSNQRDVPWRNPRTSLAACAADTENPPSPLFCLSRPMPKRSRPVDFPSPQQMHCPVRPEPLPTRINDWAQELLQRGRICNVRQPWATAIMNFGKTIENRRAPWGSEQRWLRCRRRCSPP